MRKVYFFLIVVMIACIGCEWRLKSTVDSEADRGIVVERYDRIESQYLMTGDFSALQQMNIGYPMQTRMLIEDVLRIGKVNDPEINNKFLNFYQDTTLQSLIREVEEQYADMDDINRDLDASFKRLQKELPGIELPQVYAQIGSLDQSIIVGNNMLGISLDKYLGADFQLYQRFYPASQRQLMTRAMIIPDCLGFYLLSLYPMPHNKELTQLDCDIHMGKIQWVVNKVMDKRIFNNEYVKTVDRYMKANKGITVEQLLINNDYISIIQT